MQNSDTIDEDHVPHKGTVNNSDKPLPLREEDTSEDTGGVSPLSDTPVRKHHVQIVMSSHSPTYHTTRRQSRSSMAVDQAEKLSYVIENELYKKLNVVYVALLGFVIVGLCAVCCICFGIVEITQKDRIFANIGLGEVLTVLGTYFMIPYIFIIVAFVVLTHKVSCMTTLGSAIASRFTPILVGVCIFFFVIQQGFTNAYLVILTESKYILLIIVADLATFGSLLYFWRTPYGHMTHIVLFTLKLAIQWRHAYDTLNQPVLGPNGVNAMLYLCVPLVQLPLHGAFLRDDSEERKGNDSLQSENISPIEEKQRKFLPKSPVRECSSTTDAPVGQPYTFTSMGYGVVLSNSNNSRQRERNRARKRASEFVEAYAANSNLYLSHLLHSLDIFSLYAYSFAIPGTNSAQVETPAPFRTLLTILFCVTFMVNNITVLFLFFKRPGSEEAVIPGFPKKVLEAATGGRRSQSVGSDALMGGRGADPVEAKRLREEASYHNRMFQYMLLMVVVCDIPLLIARMEIWRKDYGPITIFIAKNIKEIIDMCVVMMRVNELENVNMYDDDVAAPFANFTLKQEGAQYQGHVSFGKNRIGSQVNFSPHESQGSREPNSDP